MIQDNFVVSFTILQSIYMYVWVNFYNCKLFYFKLPMKIKKYYIIKKLKKIYHK